MSPKVQRAAPPYLQIADHFRRSIRDGVLPEGAQLPPIAAIAQEWEVATATAAKALAHLRTEGYVTSTSQGTFASIVHKLTTGPDRLRMLRATGTGYRPGERVEILTADLTHAPNDVADALGLTPGDPVIRRQRRYDDDHGVIALSTSWLPAPLAEHVPELLATQPLPRMTFGLVEERTGRRVVRRRDVVAIRPVPTDAVSALGLAVGTPALTMTNHYWDQNGDATEYAVDFLAAGRELSAESTVD